MKKAPKCCLRKCDGGKMFAITFSDDSNKRVCINISSAAYANGACELLKHIFVDVNMRIMK
jgi:hypothetical protein